MKKKMSIAEKILPYLDATILIDSGAYIAGGGRLLHDLSEYRQTKDIDLAMSSKNDYGKLRTLIREQGPEAIFQKPLLPIIRFSEVSGDRDAVRFLVFVDNEPLKVEIIHEGRVEFSPPSLDASTQLPMLTKEDCFTAKLLSNSDRGFDKGTFSRDLIDLCVMRAKWGEIPQASMDKAISAYTPSVIKDFKKTLESVFSDSNYRQKCYKNLGIKNKALIFSGLCLLCSDFGIAAPKADYDEDPEDAYNQSLFDR